MSPLGRDRELNGFEGHDSIQYALFPPFFPQRRVSQHLLAIDTPCERAKPGTESHYLSRAARVTSETSSREPEIGQLNNQPPSSKATPLVPLKAQHRTASRLTSLRRKGLRRGRLEELPQLKLKLS
jgi:hypothetical protein